LPEVYFERAYLHCIAYVIWLAQTMVLHAKLVLVCSRQGHVSLSIVLANYGLGADATERLQANNLLFVWVVLEIRREM
jgi:hypothetical protein